MTREELKLEIGKRVSILEPGGKMRNLLNLECSQIMVVIDEYLDQKNDQQIAEEIKQIEQLVELRTKLKLSRKTRGNLINLMNGSLSPQEWRNELTEQIKELEEYKLSPEFKAGRKESNPTNMSFKEKLREALREEWCTKKGFNFIDFDSISEAEEYILHLEQKIMTYLE